MNISDRLDINLRPQLDAAQKQLEHDPEGGLAALNDIFHQGVVPNPLPNGRYWGGLITSTLNPLLDNFLGGVTQLWFPWQGKTFDAATQTGDNIFTNDGLLIGRLLWPFYDGYIPDGRGRSRAFKFSSSIGPCALDPAIEVFRMNFNLEGNPNFLVRELVDELRQIDEDYYLGKAVLGNLSGKPYLAAYFTLRSGLNSPYSDS